MNVICPRCGNSCAVFYNAGIPVWGCMRCFKAVQISCETNANSQGEYHNVKNQY